MKGHRACHRYGRRSACPVLCVGVETRPLCSGALGRRCLRGPAGEPARPCGVRSSLTKPPSWLASCPAGCPAGVRMPPTRPAPAPGGVSIRGSTPGTTSSGSSSSCSHGDPVALSPTLPSVPEGSFGSTARVRGRLQSPRTHARGRSSPVRRCLLLLRRPHPTWAGGRRRQARRHVKPRR